MPEALCLAGRSNRGKPAPIADNRGVRSLTRFLYHAARVSNKVTMYAQAASGHPPSISERSRRLFGSTSTLTAATNSIWTLVSRSDDSGGLQMAPGGTSVGSTPRSHVEGGSATFYSTALQLAAHEAEVGHPRVATS
jgi:hypothetical protein